MRRILRKSLAKGSSDMEIQVGKQSLAFAEAPYIISSASIVGKKEGEGPLGRSEERRVGKECRSRWSPYH